MEANKRELDVDWDQFYPVLQEILRRVPGLNDSYLESLINSPEAFSPDCKWILGEAPEVTAVRWSKNKTHFYASNTFFLDRFEITWWLLA